MSLAGSTTDAAGGRGNRYILGVQGFASQDAGAALIECSADGRLLRQAAISEERLIRRKHPYTFPLHSIAYCMDQLGLTRLDEIETLATDYIHARRWFNTGLAYRAGEFDYLKLKFDFDPARIRTVRHHEAHAAAAYHTSGFDHAAILIVDGMGSENETTSYFEGRGADIVFHDRYAHRGVGGLYSAVTANILAFGPGGEGKTMGLAPYGAAHPPALRLEGRLDGIVNDYADFMRRRPYSDVLTYVDPSRRIDPIKAPHARRAPGADPLDPYFARAAYETQAEAERALVHLARDIKRRTGASRLCVAGGVGLNSVANKRMLDEAGYDDIFVFPACGDAGVPLGLALWAYHNFMVGSRRDRVPLRSASTGRVYGAAEIAATLDAHGLRRRPVTPADVAGMIAAGRVVGWFQGGSEYGPRALGHRSILADARDPGMALRVNERVKHRETWRPFAPAVTLDHASEYFDLDGRPSPFMLLVAGVRRPDLLPSVTHVDGTARVQTVTPADNGAFHELVAAFGDATGTPCVLNTSFNDDGEPIVETPEDAVICFLRTGMDHLVLEGVAIDADDVPDRAGLALRLAEARDARLAARHAALVARFCPGYDAAERDAFLREANKIAEWHAVYEAKHRLDALVLDWLSRGVRVLLVGTPDHTAALRRRIPGFAQLPIAGFAHFEGRHDLEAGVVAPYPSASLDAAADTWDAILISSHEHQPEIERALRERGLMDRAAAIYGTTGRNLMEALRDFPEIRAG